MKIIRNKKESIASECFIGIILLQRYRFCCRCKLIGCRFGLCFKGFLIFSNLLL